MTGPSVPIPIPESAREVVHDALFGLGLGLSAAVVHRIVDATMHGLVADGYVVLKEDPDHVIELRADDFTLQHSLGCRLAGTLFDCPVHDAARALSSPHELGVELGRYVVVLERGELQIVCPA